MLGYSFGAFIIVIGVLVFFHELGHFLAARICRVGVLVFSLGFGPKIFKKKVGMTEYCISAIPLGGYVKMFGEEPDSEIKPEEISMSFTHKPLLQKSFIVAAGASFNFILAIFIFWVLCQYPGFYLAKPIIGKVIENSPAFSAGLQTGDIIKQIDKTTIKSFDDLSKVIQSCEGNELSIIVEREGEIVTIPVKPGLETAKNLFGEDHNVYRVGITDSGEVFHQRLNPIQAVGYSLQESVKWSKLMMLGIWKMISGKISAKNMGGPIMIAQEAGKQAKAGVANLSFFIALISINLGIINLFPIPVLDGGHLLFYGIEAITRKPVSNTIREKCMQFGLAVLVALMVFVFYNDIMRIISPA